MKRLDRTKNAGRNIFYGSAIKVYQIVIPFLLRTAMIYYMGMEYIGLNGLFGSILQVLNLAELGIGSAMVFSMYKPIAENDDATICALLKLYRIYYRIVGLIILTAGILLLPFLSYLINGNVPAGINIYYLYLLNLGATILSYWLFAYRNSILIAYQRNDIISKVAAVAITLEYAFQLIAIIGFHSYYYYLTAKLFSQIIQNIIIAFIAKRMFPQYTPKGKLEIGVIIDINQRVKDLFTAKIGGVIVNSVDTIVISAFLGLYILGIYNNYYYILTSVIGFMYVIFSACTAGIGNSLVTETTEKNYFDFQVFSLIICWISGFCTCSLLCLYQPFMLFWIKDRNLMFGDKEVICFCAYFFVYELAAMMIQYKDASGMWHEDRFRPLVTALTNLAMNIFLVKYIGILGILLSTVFSFVFVGIPWLIRNIFKIIFKRSAIPYVRKLVFYLFIVMMSCVFTYIVCAQVSISGLLGLVIRGVLCFVISNGLYWAFLHNTKEYMNMIVILKRMLKFKTKIRL